VWDRDEYQRYKEQYYSMALKVMTLINGKALDQCEVVKPVGSVSKFGPAGTQYPLLIGSRIDFVRSGGDALRKE
jgi:hypothetical protein